MRFPQGRTKPLDSKGPMRWTEEGGHTKGNTRIGRRLGCQFFNKRLHESWDDLANVPGFVILEQSGWNEPFLEPAHGFLSGGRWGPQSYPAAARAHYANSGRSALTYEIPDVQLIPVRPIKPHRALSYPLRSRNPQALYVRTSRAGISLSSAWLSASSSCTSLEKPRMTDPLGLGRKQGLALPGLQDTRQSAQAGGKGLSSLAQRPAGSCPWPPTQ